MKKFLKRVKMAAFNVYVALNMLLCSILFIGQSYPRETVSGFLGRRAILGSFVCLYLAKFIDMFYRDPAHCGETALAEDQMRIDMYPDAPLLAMPPQAEPRA